MIKGRVPTLIDPPPGCRFADRCPQRMDRCTTATPALVELDDGSQVRCFLHSDATSTRVPVHSPGGGVVTALVEASGDRQDVPAARRDARSGPRRRARRRPRRSRHQRRRGARPRRRVGLRQDDAVAHLAAPARSRRGHAALRRSGPARRVAPGVARPAQEHPGRVPGPVLVARPPRHGRRLDRRGPARPRRREGRARAHGSTR